MTQIKKIESSRRLPKLLRVAAYARVSRNKESLLHSFNNQVEHYRTYIQSRKDYIFKGVYADLGISGTKDDRAFLKQFETYISCEKIADQVISPKTLAVNITGISLYQEAVSAGLRGSRKSEHWFSYLVMRKGADLF